MKCLYCNNTLELDTWEPDSDGSCITSFHKAVYIDGKWEITFFNFFETDLITFSQIPTNFTIFEELKREFKYIFLDEIDLIKTISCFKDAERLYNKSKDIYMKKYRLYRSNDQYNCERIYGNYFTYLTFPPEFDISDIEKDNFFSKTIKEKAKSLKIGNSIKICKMSRSSNFYLEAFDDTEINAIRTNLETINLELESVRKELYKLAGTLVDKEKQLLKDRVKVQKELKELT